jgi:hypothetical protein
MIDIIRRLFQASVVASLGVALPSVATAQSPVGDHAIVIREPDDRSGPRAGVAYLIGGSVTEERSGKTISPVVSLFGWQIEHAFYAGENLPTPVTELVVLVGGLEQSRVLPSASWLIGLRQRNGIEFGLGPTVTGAGTQIAFAGGVTHHFGEINVPVNFAFAPGRRGASLSITAGFNWRR